MTEDELILTSILDCDRTDLYSDPQPLSEEQQSQYDQIKQRRKEGEPLQYVLGSCEFMGLPLRVDERVLIPRPETELLVDCALQKTKGFDFLKELQILDLGTGSGNIAISCAKFIEDCYVTAVDLSPEAIALAEKNAWDNDVDHKIVFIQSDMINYLQGRMDQVDMIISNPPYIKTADMYHLPEDVQREPRVALDGGEDGLYFYRQIIGLSQQRLTDGGFLLMEIDDGQQQDIGDLFSDFPSFTNIDFQKDYVGTDRIVVAQLNHRVR